MMRVEHRMMCSQQTMMMTTTRYWTLAFLDRKQYVFVNIQMHNVNGDDYICDYLILKCINWYACVWEFVHIENSLINGNL